MRSLFRFLNRVKSFFIITNLKLENGKSLKLGKVRTRGGLKINVDKKAHCAIEGAFFNYGCSISCLHSIKIGKNCIFGENVKIYDHNHIFKKANIPFSKQGFKTKEIVIGNNVWIGSNCVILKGVCIGDNVVVGANCVISENIPPNTLVKRKSDEQISSPIIFSSEE